MKRIIIPLIVISAAVLSFSNCSKKDKPKPIVIGKAIDTINLNGRWSGVVYTADNSTLGSFELMMTETSNPSDPHRTVIKGTIATPPLCKEMENQGHTSIPLSDMSGSRDFDQHEILVQFFYTTKRFQNGNVVPGETVGWNFEIDSLWVNDRGMQLTDKPVVEGPARVTANCNTQGYRVRLNKL
ncbi:MAG: hypothetical protein DI535_09080 [Citrobacter freundii]|nr:MAG: hypothetical protein DI535_09080 [Citrobacter freundii]